MHRLNLAVVTSLSGRSLFPRRPQNNRWVTFFLAAAGERRCYNLLLLIFIIFYYLNENVTVKVAHPRVFFSAFYTFHLKGQFTENTNQSECVCLSEFWGEFRGFGAQLIIWGNNRNAEKKHKDRIVSRHKRCLRWRGAFAFWFLLFFLIMFCFYGFVLSEMLGASTAAQLFLI